MCWMVSLNVWFEGMGGFLRCSSWASKYFDFIFTIFGLSDSILSGNTAATTTTATAITEASAAATTTAAIP